MTKPFSDSVTASFEAIADEIRAHEGFDEEATERVLADLIKLREKVLSLESTDRPRSIEQLDEIKPLFRKIIQAAPWIKERLESVFRNPALSIKLVEMVIGFLSGEPPSES